MFSKTLVALLSFVATTPAIAFTDYYADKQPPKPAEEAGAVTFAPPVSQKQRFHATMDRVFGEGRWRETSGWRSQGRENELRREGAGTVRPGEISHHSMGTLDAPGAYDVVVRGMSNDAAAARLRTESADFSRVFAEGAHGREGQHLHLEPNYGTIAAAESGSGVSALRPIGDDNIYLRISNGRRNPSLGPVVVRHIGS